MSASENAKQNNFTQELLVKAFRLMSTAKQMAELFEENKDVTAKYVHATSRGHEAIQLACALNLLPCDFISPYYRDDSILLGIGMQPFDCSCWLRRMTPSAVVVPTIVTPV
jgi:2-oxoisovalerate dehydrogenase E1 component